VTKLLAFIPGIGPVLSAVWSARYFILAGAIFYGGWEAKGWVDQAATTRAVLAKTRIDLRATTESAEHAGAVLAELHGADKRNQEIIRDLNDKLAQRAAGQPVPAAACAVDDAIARKLRSLR
jgi:hypothetical protein